jgi:hypothetical protein
VVRQDRGALADDGIDTSAAVAISGFFTDTRKPRKSLNLRGQTAISTALINTLAEGLDRITTGGADIASTLYRRAWLSSVALP